MESQLIQRDRLAKGNTVTTATLIQVSTETMETLLLKIFWVVARRQFLVYNQRFGITCLSHLQGLRPKILSNITTTAEAFNYIHGNTVTSCD
jgi:hypothetical protein